MIYLLFFDPISFDNLEEDCNFSVENFLRKVLGEKLVLSDGDAIYRLLITGVLCPPGFTFS